MKSSDISIDFKILITPSFSKVLLWVLASFAARIVSRISPQKYSISCVFNNFKISDRILALFRIFVTFEGVNKIDKKERALTIVSLSFVLNNPENTNIISLSSRKVLAFFKIQKCSNNLIPKLQK